MPVEVRAEVAGAVIPAAPLCPIDVAGGRAGEHCSQQQKKPKKNDRYGKRKQLVHEALSKFIFFLYYITVPPI